MALTYDQHKAAIDAAYPTPPVDWVRQDDHVNFGHHEVASPLPWFSTQRITITSARTTKRAAKRFGRFGAFLEDGLRGYAGGVQPSWDDAKVRHL